MELKVRKLSNFLKSCKGLIGEENPYPVFFKTRFGIHTFFMKFPIDVLILDDKNKAVVIHENLRPFRIFCWNPIYDKVVELPTGTIRSLNIAKGNHIKLVAIN
jgi:uncharacterized membrane protein (UPF0127 family)